ncbi:MAG TPA: T9SS type A sorting domain-containing protein, partial [Bacteroidia bacterium]|nr:T9SS type A sorting domain-containing protein [Bacteroidia bacterium]
MTNRRYLILTFSLIISFFSFNLYADRIYIMPGLGYNQADSAIINAIINNGHTVVVGATTSTTLPPNFTSACNDPVNGYHWLCLFGDMNYVGLQTQIKAFIDAGSKVYVQHEVSCCTVASAGAASIAAFITGLPIMENGNPYIALSTTMPPGWESGSPGECGYFAGNAYKCMDNVPAAKQLKATADLNGGAPSYTICENFGMFFSTIDFTGTAHNGAFVAIGDVNLFFGGFEPPGNGGIMPVDTNVIDYFFPNSASGCFLFPPGCITTTSVNILKPGKEEISVYIDIAQQLMIDFKSITPGEVTVINSIGQEILFFDPAGQKHLSIPVSEWANGIYLIKVKNNSQLFIK